MCVCVHTRLTTPQITVFNNSAASVLSVVAALARLLPPDAFFCARCALMDVELRRCTALRV